MHTNINMNMREQRCNLNLYASTVVTRTLDVGSVHQTGKQGKLPLTLYHPITASTPVYAPYC